ncbi:MAG: alkaline phosphatase family protein, partial [Candidatus Binatia bacterium]
LDVFLNPIYSLELLLSEARVLRLAHPPREMLRRPPFWEPLSRAGVRSAVVRFRFTFPASGRADVVISDWAGQDQWSVAGVDTDAEEHELATPAAAAHELLAPFVKEAIARTPPLTDFVADPDRPKPVGAKIHPLEMLRFALEIDARTLEATHAILRRDRDLGVVAVYLGGLDSVSHAFWEYRFPEEFPRDPPAAPDVAAFSGVIERYLSWLDGQLGELAAAFPSPPNVIVVSDHGYEAIHSHVLFRGWHAARDAIFLAAGPDVPRQSARIDVSYFDIAPSVIELAGFAPPEALTGRSLFRP